MRATQWAIVITAIALVALIAGASVASEDSDAAINIGEYDPSSDSNDSTSSNAYGRVQGTMLSLSDFSNGETIYVLDGAYFSLHTGMNTHLEITSSNPSNLEVQQTQLNSTVNGPIDGSGTTTFRIYTDSSSKTFYVTALSSDTTVYVTSVHIVVSPSNPSVGDTITVTAYVTPSNATYATTSGAFSFGTDNLSQREINGNVLTGVVSEAREYTFRATAQTNLYSDLWVESDEVTITVSEAPDPEYTYTLSYSANGGSGGPSTQRYGPTTATSHTFTIPDTEPTRTNYTFLAWGRSPNDEDNSEAWLYPGDTYTCRSDDPDRTLYAMWSYTPTTNYVVYFNANGGSGGPGTISSGAITAQTYRVEIPDQIPTRTGFEFIGWARLPAWRLVHNVGNRGQHCIHYALCGME